jgi:D-sedoheptulose 7-phosphate isomerase
MRVQEKALEHLQKSLEDSLAVKKKFFEEHGNDLVRAAESISETVKNGGKLLIFGNGGSAADSQHMAAEMIGRMMKERRPLPAIALSTDTSNLTAVGNDYGYDQVFVRQVEALAKPGDIAVGISTSGNSPNVLLAAKKAKEMGCLLISMTGGSGGELKPMADFGLNVSLGKNSPRIQETHIFIVHSLIDLMDEHFLT